MVDAIRNISYGLERKRIMDFRRLIPMGYKCNHTDEKFCSEIIPFSRFEWIDACKFLGNYELPDNYVKVVDMEGFNKFHCPFSNPTAGSHSSPNGSYCKLVNGGNDKSAIHDRRPICCRAMDYISTMNCPKCSPRLTDSNRAKQGQIYTTYKTLDDYIEFIVNSDLMDDHLADPNLFLTLYKDAGNDINNLVLQKMEKENIEKTFLFQKMEQSKSKETGSTNYADDNIEVEDIPVEKELSEKIDDKD
jgi:hypothetical protein